jgi:hypothetical protein
MCIIFLAKQGNSKFQHYTFFITLRRKTKINFKKTCNFGCLSCFVCAILLLIDLNQHWGRTQNANFTRLIWSFAAQNKTIFQKKFATLAPKAVFCVEFCIFALKEQFFWQNWHYFSLQCMFTLFNWPFIYTTDDGYYR